MKKNKDTQNDPSKAIMQACLPISKAFVVFGYAKGGSGEKYFLAVHDTEEERAALNELGGPIGAWLQMGKHFKQANEAALANQANGRIAQ